MFVVDETVQNARPERKLKEYYPDEVTKYCLIYFRYIAKCHSIYNKIGQKDSAEQNRSSSSEKKGRITRMEVDFSSSILISWQVVKKSKFTF